MKKEMIVLVTAFTLLLPAMLFLQVITIPEYSILKNTLFELGSQSAPHGWIINLIFIFLALGSVFAGWYYYKGFTFNRLILLIFSLSLVLAASLNVAPVNKDFIYNIKEAEWHAYFESTALLSFVILSLSTSIISEKQPGRMLSVAAGLSVIFLSVLMSETERFAGIWHRFIFTIISCWLIYTFGIRK